MKKEARKSNGMVFQIESIKESNSKYFITLTGRLSALHAIEPSNFISISENGFSRNIRINDVRQKGMICEMELAKSDVKGMTLQKLVGKSFPVKGALNLANTSNGFGVSLWTPIIILGVLVLLSVGLWILKA